ncbi:MAG: amidohydrolase family protein [Candidatus Aminicenantes bacterium]|nr:amidohydrolase family protein [Candidatus Aminicenantes bacterium]
MVFLLSVLFSLYGFSKVFPADKDYPALRSVIEDTRWIDVHAHPVIGHRDFGNEDPYPTLEPPISRPYWPLEKRRIAVYDSLQAEALRAIYGYRFNDVQAKDIPDLRRRSIIFWKASPVDAMNRVLDICGIDRVFANTSLPPRDVDRRRVLWVPFVDELFYPFAGRMLRDVSPEFKRSLDHYSERVNNLSASLRAPVGDFIDYLRFVDRILADYGRQGAVALKVASAYIRSLHFDDPSFEDAASVYRMGLEGRLWDKSDYKRLQDFIARHIFLKAGELNLPIHFHTGFGADAGLQNLDSHPLNLESVCSDRRFDRTRFLVLHAGYPFWNTIKPLLEKRNVCVEFSAVNWMVYDFELADILEDWLRYPGLTDKIMFGSDAGAPVFFWIAAENSRRALYTALAALADKGITSESDAVVFARNIMRSNALRFHGLK